MTGGYTNLYTTEDLQGNVVKVLSGRNRTSDPVIADIYSHMLYQLSYAEGWMNFMQARPLSSVVEHSAAVRMVPGSNPGVPSVCKYGRAK